VEMGYKCNKARRFGTEICGDVTLPGVMDDKVYFNISKKDLLKIVNISKEL
jgi:hypothetical protein